MIRTSSDPEAAASLLVWTEGVKSAVTEEGRQASCSISTAKADDRHRGVDAGERMTPPKRRLIANVTESLQQHARGRHQRTSLPASWGRSCYCATAPTCALCV